MKSLNTLVTEVTSHFESKKTMGRNQLQKFIFEVSQDEQYSNCVKEMCETSNFSPMLIKDYMLVGYIVNSDLNTKQFLTDCNDIFIGGITSSYGLEHLANLCKHVYGLSKDETIALENNTKVFVKESLVKLFELYKTKPVCYSREVYSNFVDILAYTIESGIQVKVDSKDSNVEVFVYSYHSSHNEITRSAFEVVYRKDGTLLNKVFKKEYHQINITAPANELRSICLSLLNVKDIVDTNTKLLVIYTESTYVLNKIDSWRKNGISYINTFGNEIANIEMWNKLIDLVKEYKSKGVDVRIRKLKSPAVTKKLANLF